MTELKGWTDYPIVELGDVPGQLAPIREAIATHYDGDKYINAQVAGLSVQFKSGYFYRNPGRAGEAEYFSHEELNGLPRVDYD